MKKIILSIILFATLLTGYTQSFQVNRSSGISLHAAGTACQDKISLIAQRYDQQFNHTNRFQVSLYTQTIMDGQPGPVVETNIAKDGQKVKMQSEFFTLYRDETVSLMVLKDSKSIILKDSSDSTVMKFNAIPMQEKLDSFMTLAPAFDCEGKGNLKILYPEAAYPITKGLKHLEMEFDPKDGSIAKAVYYYVGYDNTTNKQVKEYKGFTEHLSGVVFEGSALSQVLNKDMTLKETYAQYQLSDLRTN